MISAVVWNTLGCATAFGWTIGSGVERDLVFRPSMSPANSHGQKLRATIVKTISEELERVLVEQNHCQGLNRVMRSCTKYLASIKSQSHLRLQSEFTYRGPGSVASTAIYSLCEFPGIEISYSSKHALHYSGKVHQNHGSELGKQRQ